MKTMINFFKALLQMPKPWVAWVMLLMTVNMVVPIFFIETLEAQVVLATMMASAALMMFLFAQKGFVRLLGLGHVLWIPLILWLSARVDFASASTGVEQWLLAVIALNGLSLIIDTVDVIRYAKGERAQRDAGPNIYVR
ncbi:MAG: hypothetical protein O3A78_11700 [Nitrospinae bacterium]|nr:hypothetical protein [Nitrospinota bacterium]MDA1110451.1 hypothetical protein [Nitrospinota bacterium]